MRSCFWYHVKIEFTTRRLLYDGHGSTRQLVSGTSTVSVSEQYNYDAYGVGLSLPGSPGASLLYAGEQFDLNLQQYYLRARYYDPSNGRFNRLDPFAGRNFDPQSLHKYDYAHGDPVNGVDPSGRFFENPYAVLAALLIVAALALWGLWKVFGEPGTKGVNATPIPSGELDSIISVLKFANTHYWQASTDLPNDTKSKVDSLLQHLSSTDEENQFVVLVYPAGKGPVGAHFPWTPKRGYISQAKIDDGYLTAGLAIFGEFQHDPWGGNIQSESVAQQEFDKLRDALPDFVRTTETDLLTHGKK
jgi:RHS repeat-associated protein